MIRSIHGNPSSCHHEAARLLPWLVAGALSERETERVQQHLGECKVCAADWQREQQVQSLICDEPIVEHAPQPGLQNLLSRIDELERELPCASGATAVVASARGRRFGAVRWLAAAVLVQAVGLGILGMLFWNRGVELRQPRFHTLTTAAPVRRDAQQIRVVFAPAMQVGELQALLKSIPATVLSGPSEAGVYTLALSGERVDVGGALADLRANAGVLFAEPQSPAESPE